MLFDFFSTNFSVLSKSLFSALQTDKELKIEYRRSKKKKITLSEKNVPKYLENSNDLRFLFSFVELFDTYFRKATKEIYSVWISIMFEDFRKIYNRRS